MKYVDLFHLKPVQLTLLLITAFIGIFFLVKYSEPEAPEKEASTISPPDPGRAERKKEPLLEKEEISFDEQCRDILYEIQACIHPFSSPADRESSPLILVTPEQKKNVPSSVVFLKPLRKKQRTATPGELIRPANVLRQKKLSQPVVLLKPLRKKKHTFAPGELIRPANVLRQKTLSRPVVVPLKPLQKKQHTIPRGETIISANSLRQNRLPRPLLLLKALQKKKRIASSSKKTVKKSLSNIFGKDDQVSFRGELLPAVLATVASLEAQSIRYGVGPLSDCSGIVHRVLMGIKKWQPEYAYPQPHRYRDSRDLARWYYERGQLILIRNALAQSDLIRPGMVLFFGHNGVMYKNASVRTLFSPQRGIDHVGVVVRVYKDNAGKVTGYELFHGHGRRGRTKASITKWHKRKPTRAGYPPLGNGRQQLLAAARIVRAR